MENNKNLYKGTYYSLSGAMVKKPEVVLFDDLESSIEKVLATNEHVSCLIKTNRWALIDITKPRVGKKKIVQARMLVTKD